MQADEVVRAKNAIESTFEGRVDVYEYVKGLNGSLTTAAEVLTMQSIACRLSYQNLYPAVQSKGPDYLRLQGRLFVASEVDIKEGSKLVIEQNNKTTIYKSTGAPAVYPTHREYMVELFDNWG